MQLFFPQDVFEDPPGCVEESATRRLRFISMYNSISLFSLIPSKPIDWCGSFSPENKANLWVNCFCNKQWRKRCERFIRLATGTIISQFDWKRTVWIFELYLILQKVRRYLTFLTFLHLPLFPRWLPLSPHYLVSFSHYSLRLLCIEFISNSATLGNGVLWPSTVCSHLFRIRHVFIRWTLWIVEIIALIVALHYTFFAISLLSKESVLHYNFRWVP